MPDSVDVLHGLLSAFYPRPLTPTPETLLEGLLNHGRVEKGEGHRPLPRPVTVGAMAKTEASASQVMYNKGAGPVGSSKSRQRLT